MKRTGLTIRGGLIITATLLCIPGAYRAGELAGFRNGEKTGADAMATAVDGHLYAWLQDEQCWLALREHIFSQQIRPSKAPYWRDRMAGQEIVGSRD